MPMPNLPPPEELVTPPELTEAHKLASTISAAKDSVWVIQQELTRETFTRNSLSLLRANVSHLELVMGSTAVINSGEDLSDITAAINSGKEAITLLESAST